MTNTAESTNKRPRVEGDKVIGTHSGSFHCDEILACFMLLQLPEYQNAKIVRTRDQAEIDKCDIVVDVGGIFDHSKKRYDHHQKTFNETFSSLVPEYEKGNIRLSSAGLIYVHYGKQVLKELIKKDPRNTNQLENDDEFINVLYIKVYAHLIKEIDAIDNGVNIADERRYEISTNLSARVGRFNPEWNDEGKKNENDQFYLAMDIVGAELVDQVGYYSFVWWAARSIVAEAIKNRFDVHSSGAIVKFDSLAPWKSHLFQIEQDLGIKNNELLYVLYPDKDKSWRVQCIPVSEQSFTNRKSLPSAWCGIRDAELDKVSGISGCVFVHAGGFIGGNKTYEGALAMLVKALD